MKKKIVFTEEFCQPENLFPFTLTRQIQDIRIGVLTIREKWEMVLGLESMDKDEGDYKDLEKSVDIATAASEGTVYLIHGNILPTPSLVKQLKKLKPGEFISLPGTESIIYCISVDEVIDSNKIRVTRGVEFRDEDFREIKFPWHIFQYNDWAIRKDFDLLSSNGSSRNLPAGNTLTGDSGLFIDKSATVLHSCFNTTDGPIFIGPGAKVMEGCLIRGPVAICEGAVLKMGTRIYGASTVGPYSTVGGEIKNSVIFGYSNKAHDGYLGDSVIGEWCNLGAGTSNSNLKNTASDIQIWTPHGPVNVGTKCGVIMGDYSRTAINTSINTGTVIGVCAHVAGQGLTPKYIPSFSWGSDGVERYELEKAFSNIANWKAFKHQEITENDKFILKHIFDHY